MLRKEMTFLPSHKATVPKFHVSEEPFMITLSVYISHILKDFPTKLYF